MATTENVHFVFVYGSLKRGQPQENVMTDESNGKATFVGRGKTVSKYPLVIGSKFNIPYLLLKEGVGNRIIGDVYQVDSKKLDFLDRFEGCPTFYQRLMIQVELQEEGKETRVIDVFSYLAVNFKSSLLEREMFTDYDSNGPHGLPFITRDKRPKKNVVIQYYDTDEDD